MNKSDIDWQVYRAASIPAPNAYAVGSFLSKTGGGFNLGRSKSDLEWQIHRAKETPAPNAYGGSLKPPRTPGGRFNAFKSKTWLERLVREKIQIPGPSEYRVGGLRAPSGGTFNASKPKSDSDWAIYRSSQIPGPGQYKVDGQRPISGGSFNMSKAKSHVEWIEYRAGQLPGPSDYGNVDRQDAPNAQVGLRRERKRGDAGREGMKNQECAVRTAIKSVLAVVCFKAGVKHTHTHSHTYHNSVCSQQFSMAKPKTDVDWAILRASTMPGPGENHRPMKMAALEKRGGQFRKGNAKSDVDWQVLRASQVRTGCMVQYAVWSHWNWQFVLSEDARSFVLSLLSVRLLPYHPRQPLKLISCSSHNVSLSKIGSAHG